MQLEEEPTGKCQPQRGKVLHYIMFSWLVFVLIVTGAGYFVFLTKANFAVQNSFFVMWMGVVFAVPLNGLLLLLRWDKIPKSERLVPHWKLLLMAVLMDAYGLLMVFSVSHVSGVFLAVMSKVVLRAKGVAVVDNVSVVCAIQAVLSIDVTEVPIGMFISIVILRKKFSLGVYLSLVVILAGIAVGTWSQLLHSPPVDIAPSPIPRFVWVVLYGLAAPFLIVVIILQDEVVKHLPYQSSIYMQFWVNVYSFITTPLLIPITFIPGLGTSHAGSFFQEQARALYCFLDIPGGCSGLPLPCNCGVAFENVLLASICAVSSCVAGIGVLLYANATYLFIVSTITTPLIAISFAIPFVMAPYQAQPLHFMIWISLGILVFGMSCYAFLDSRSRSQEQPESNTETEKQPILNA